MEKSVAIAESAKKTDLDLVNQNPRNIQIITRNESYKRKLFSGLARVIIQSNNGKAGEILIAAICRIKKC